MHIRLLFVSPDEASLSLLQSIHDSAIDLMCFTTSTATVQSRDELVVRVEHKLDDVILIDWPMAEAETPHLVQELLRMNPTLRVVVLLPMNYRQYRQQVWDAGACNSIPKELMEQEWFSSIICVMHRAMEREARLRAEFASILADRVDLGADLGAAELDVVTSEALAQPSECRLSSASGSR